MRIKERKPYQTADFIGRNPSAEISRQQECQQILNHYNAFHDACVLAASDQKNNEYAYVTYLQGDPGIGKSFLCRRMHRTFREKYEKACISIYYDLQSREQTDIACYLFDLAKACCQSMQNAHLFPRFSAVFSHYQELRGQEAESIEVETKTAAISQNEYVSIASKALSFVPGISDMLDTAGSVSDLAGDLYRKGADVYLAQKYKQDFALIDCLPINNMEEHLLHYFILDFVAWQEELTRKKGKERPHTIFILDTLECSAYEDHKHDDSDSYLSWLTGKNGLIHYLPNTFWLIAGRDEIDWTKYDADDIHSSSGHKVQTSFDTLSVRQAKTDDIRCYLTDPKKGNGIPEEFADYIMEMAAGYTFKLELCVDTYFKMAGFEQQMGGAALSLNDFKEVLSGDEHKIAISNRYMLYLSKKETALLATLACLEVWTDELLRQYIWKNDISALINYQDFIKGNLICKQAGLLSLQGLDHNVLFGTCSRQSARQFKEQLYSHMQKKLSNKNAFLLFYAYCNCCIRCKSESDPNPFSFDHTLCAALEQALHYLLFNKKYALLKSLAEKLRMLESGVDALIPSFLSLLHQDAAKTYPTASEVTKRFQALSFEKHSDAQALFSVWLSFYDSLTENYYHYCLYIVLQKIRSVMPEDIPTSLAGQLDKKEFLLLTDSAAKRNECERMITVHEDLFRTAKKLQAEEGGYENQVKEYEDTTRFYQQKIEYLIPDSVSNADSLKEKTESFVKRAHEQRDEDSIRWFCRHYINTLDDSEEELAAYRHYLDLYEQCDNSAPLDQARLYHMQMNYHYKLGDYEEAVSFGLKCIRIMLEEYGEDAYQSDYLYDSIEKIYFTLGFNLCRKDICTDEDLERFTMLFSYYKNQLQIYKQHYNKDDLENVEKKEAELLEGFEKNDAEKLEEVTVHLDMLLRYYTI